ncbi:TPA: hypothetical protein SMQ86_006065 [Pseudomonas aeruginosa]|nr:hypothetical protein [Pseudomonas aeruginosa]
MDEKASYPVVERVRLKLDIHSPSPEETLLQRASALFHGALREELDRALTMAPALRIDQLVLSLGVLTAENWEAELRLRLRAYLKEQVRLWRYEAEGGMSQAATAFAFPPSSFARPQEWPVNLEKVAWAVATGAVAGKPVADSCELPVAETIPLGPKTMPTLPLASWAVACLQPERLAFWLQRLSVPTLRQVALALIEAGSAEPLGVASVEDTEAVPLVASIEQATREQLGELLPLSALLYVQRHRQEPVPPAEAPVRALTLTILRRWLPRLLPLPPREEVRRWLMELCVAPEARACLTQWLAKMEASPSVFVVEATSGGLGRSETGQGAEVDEACTGRAYEASPGPSGVGRSEMLQGGGRFEARPAAKRPPGHELQRSEIRSGREPEENPTCSVEARPDPALMRKAKAGAPDEVLRLVVARELSGASWLVQEAGIVVFWPLLPALLKHWGLVEDKRLVEPLGRYQALRCLQALVWGEEPLLAGKDWPDSVLLRVLCGIEPGEPLPVGLETFPDPDGLAELEAWLAEPPALPLADWREYGPQALRWRFLQRPGRLTLRDYQWFLEVETAPDDGMLAQVPWPLGMVSYPWLAWPLQVRFGVAAS